MHEILENGELVGRVLGELGGTLRLLDDLDENLAVFDARLRHMREDIAGEALAFEIGGWGAVGGVAQGRHHPLRLRSSRSHG